MSESTEWERLLAEREVELPSPTLAGGLAFLEHHRTGQGWGAFPGTAFDRHASAMAMEALLADRRRSDTGSQVSVTVQFFANKYRDQYRGLEADALADVALLVAPSLNKKDSEWRTLMSRADSVTTHLMRDVPPDAARRTAGIVLAFTSAGMGQLRNAQTIGGFLIAQQQGFGSWSTIPGDGGSITASSEVVRALALFETDEARRARDVALRFLRERADLALQHPSDIDTFEIALMLRALGSYSTGPYRQISALETELISRQDAQDSGWPSGQGRASSIELTALAVLAMTDAGARIHVPLRLARAAVADLTRSNLTEADGSDDVEVMQRLHVDLTRSQKTAARVPDLEREVRMLRRVNEPLTYERDLLTRRYTERATRFTLATTVVAIAAMLAVAAATSGTGETNTVAVIIGVAAVLLVSLAVAAFTQRTGALRSARVLSNSRERLFAQELGTTAHFTEDGSLSDLRRGLQFIVEDWPSTTREELRYVLYESFLSVPSDVAARRAEQVASDLGIPAKDTAQFSAWASAVGALPEDERRVLFDQVRRILL